MATAIDAAALLVYRAAWTRDRGAERITREAAMAKLAATEIAQQVIDSAVQLLGARGVVAGEPVERLYREIRALANLRRHERDSEDRDRRPGAGVTDRGDRARRHVRAGPPAAARAVAGHRLVRRAGTVVSRAAQRGRGAARRVDRARPRRSARAPSRQRHLVVPAAVRDRRIASRTCSSTTAASCRAAACCCARPISPCSSRAGSASSRPAAWR